MSVDRVDELYRIFKVLRDKVTWRLFELGEDELHNVSLDLQNRVWHLYEQEVKKTIGGM